MRITRIRLAAAGIAAIGTVGAAGAALAGGGGGGFDLRLSGYEEVPAVSSAAGGRFEARVSRFDRAIDYRLSYRDTSSTVTQAHIHFGQEHVNGGVSAFLCSNLGNGPRGTQACPAAPATVTGRIEPDNVVGPAGQGIAAGEFDELVDAIRAGVTYANVHSETYPGGEIRAQLVRDRRW